MKYDITPPDAIETGTRPGSRLASCDTNPRGHDDFPPISCRTVELPTSHRGVHQRPKQTSDLHPEARQQERGATMRSVNGSTVYSRARALAVCSGVVMSGTIVSGCATDLVDDEEVTWA